MTSALIAPTEATRVAELERARVPFVRATVVRAQRPTSAHAGDTAIVLADGAVEGFVGGSCAQASVRVHALSALATRQPVLLRIRAGAAQTVEEEGAVTVANPCLSGGSVEIFLEPHWPPPRLVVVGDTPVARALVSLGVPLGLEVDLVDAAEVGSTGPDLDGARALVVASHGRGEEPALEAALRADVPYIGLVASRTRGAGVLASLDAPGVERVHSPAGLDLGGRTPTHAALSILAELVASGALSAPELPAAALSAPEVSAAGLLAAVHPAAELPAQERPAQERPPTPTTLDPVCGMTVVVGGATPQADVQGVVWHFCSDGCRAHYLQAHSPSGPEAPSPAQASHATT